MKVNTLDEILNTYESNLRHAYETSKTGTFPTVDAKQQIQTLITEAKRKARSKALRDMTIWANMEMAEQLKEKL